MTASVSPNPSQQQQQQLDGITNNSSTDNTNTPPPQLVHHHQQHPNLHYPSQYPIMQSQMVYQGYPPTNSAYLTSPPHYPQQQQPGYPMYPNQQQLASHQSIHAKQHPMGSGGRSPQHAMHNPASASNLMTLSSANAHFEPNSKTTLWMGIDNWMDENYIRSLWMNAAGVEVNVKMIRDRYTGNPANYCFVDFPTYEQATQCVKFDGAPVPTLPETLWRLNWASGGGLHDTKAPEFSIFVGDLATEITDEILLSTFSSRYPSTKTAKVVMDPATGNSRGFGFVRFMSEDDQLRSLNEMNGMTIGQRTIRVGHATPKHRHGPGAHHHAQNAPSTATATSIHHRNFHPYPPVPQPAGGFDPNNATVFVGGLSHPVGEDEIRALFMSLGDIVLIKVPPGKNCAFVSYARREYAEKAINELNGYSLGNNKIRLSWGRPNYTGTHPGPQVQQMNYHHPSGGQRNHHGSFSGLPNNASHSPGTASGNAPHYPSGFASMGYSTNLPPSGAAAYAQQQHSAPAFAAASHNMYPSISQMGADGGPSPYGYAGSTMAPTGVYAASYPSIPAPVVSEGNTSGEIPH